MAILNTNKELDHDEIRRINNRICCKIEAALITGNHVWVITDWHLIRYDKVYNKCYERDNAADILYAAAKAIGPKDVVIFLGDLVDSEASENLSVISYYRKMNSICSVFKKAFFKVLVRGNNDKDPEKFYKGLGFDEVVDAILWREEYLLWYKEDRYVGHLYLLLHQYQFLLRLDQSQSHHHYQFHPDHCLCVRL